MSRKSTYGFPLHSYGLKLQSAVATPRCRILVFKLCKDAGRKRNAIAVAEPSLSSLSLFGVDALVRTIQAQPQGAKIIPVMPVQAL